MTTLAGHRQINIQVDNDLWDDIHLVARQRGQSMSEFLRRAADRELELDAVQSVTE
jgi:Ribbon-helix-helix protein, copG family